MRSKSLDLFKGETINIFLDITFLGVYERVDYESEMSSKVVKVVVSESSIRREPIFHLEFVFQISKMWSISFIRRNLLKNNLESSRYPPE